MECKGSVLLVEDNAELNRNNARALTMFGHEVHAALTLGAAWAYLHRAEPDIILLDVMLPDGDGIDFCAKIRGATEAHILFLTAKTAHEERVRGLSGGGDDYITKPFHPQELFARVNAALRRRAMSWIIKKGPLALDAAKARAFLHGENLLLTQREFALLRFIIRHESRHMPAEHLYERVWGQPMEDGTQALRSCLSRLRKKLEGSGFRIDFIRGGGYAFMPE